MLVDLSPAYQEHSFQSFRTGGIVSLRKGEGPWQLDPQEISGALKDGVLVRTTYTEVRNPPTVAFLDPENGRPLGWRPIIRGGTT